MFKLENLEIYQLAFIGNKSSRNVMQFFEKNFNLQLVDWRIIALLVGEDYLSFKELVERSGMDKSRISRAHVRMQKAGLVQVAEGPFDKRTLVMKLTPEGEKIMNELKPKVQEFNQWLLETLSEEEKAIFSEVLVKLKQRITLS